MTPSQESRVRGGGLAPRAARRSQQSVRNRVGRLRQRAFFIVQCAFAAAAAWAFARYVLNHPAPFFAPVAAMLTLGQSYGQRLVRAFEVMVGVAVGVLFGDVFVHLFGTGPWQVGVAVLVSMSVAVLLGAGTLIVTQAAVNATVVITLVSQPSAGVNRWVDALVGGAIALAVATVVPASPLRRPRWQAAVVARDLAGILADTATALRERDRDLARAALARARTSETALIQLRSLSKEGVEVVRLSPFRRGHLPAVQAIADLVEPLDRAVRNTRVLVRRALVAVQGEEVVPEGYIRLIADLGRVTGDIASGLQERRLLPDNVRNALGAVGRDSAQVAAHPGLSAEVMRAQVRSTVVDLLMLTGLTYDEARARVPASEEALDDDFHEGG
ncbi:MAG TPA: FUSC family protein [Dermatophilaceae bacterium]|nr:FUSC family protein [Dermatophilaceae bacterium]